MSLYKSIVEAAALEGLRELGYDVLSGVAVSPGEPAAERTDYKQVLLFDRLETKLEDLNSKIPQERLRDALPPKLLSGELSAMTIQLTISVALVPNLVSRELLISGLETKESEP